MAERERKGPRLPVEAAMQREERKAMTEQTPDAPAQEPPCIHTLATGKHEWNCFHWVHQAHAPFSYPQCPLCGWIDLDLMVKEAGLVKADAPGGERAQDEPPMIVRNSVGMKPPNGHDPFTWPGWLLAVFSEHREGCPALPDGTKRHVSCDCGLSAAIEWLNAASPRPAEPEPPKAEPEQVAAPYPVTLGASDDSMDWISAARRLGESLAADGPEGYYTFTPEQWFRWASAAVALLKFPPPKAAAGTLEARIEKALAEGAHVIELHGEDDPTVAFCPHADLLRDALAELRRRQEELAQYRRTNESVRVCANHTDDIVSDGPFDCVICEVENLNEALEARASSPDLRALVEKCREKERAYARAAAHHNDPQVGFANICKWFADELEAALTGTGEQK